MSYDRCCGPICYQGTQIADSKSDITFYWGLKDEERESFRLEEVVEPPNHDPNALKFESLVENKSELPPIQPILPAPMLTLDKGIFTEHRIKRKDPHAGHGGNPGEAAIKKVHME